MSGDEFDQLVADLDLTEPEIDHKFTEMTPLLLMKEFHRVKTLLEDRGTLLDPKTDEDIDLQGYYFGLVGEMRRRGMK